MKKTTLVLVAMCLAGSSFAQITVEELWNFSVQKGNAPLADDIKNGIAVSGDQLFLGRRDAAKPVAIYSAVTGLSENANLPAAANGFIANSGGDVATDDNGAVYACNVIISTNGKFQIMKWAGVTEAPTVFIETTNHPGGAANRVGYGMAVKIDKEGNGCVIAPVGATNKILYWKVTNGTPEAQDPQILSVTGLDGAYARVYIVDEDHFWIDGNTLRPQYCTKVGDVVTSTTLGWKTELNIGVCGITEFKYANKRFAVVAANNHSANHLTAPKHSAIIYELASEGVAYVSQIALVPEEGLGGTADASHFVSSVVDVKEDGAHIYLMGGFNGIAAYKLYDPNFVSVKDVAQSTISVFANAGKIEVRGIEGNADVQIVDMTGRTLVKRTVSENATLAIQPGIYLVSVKASQEVKTVKVVVD